MDLTYTALLLIIMLFNIVVMLLRIPMLSFIIGIFSIGAAGSTLAPTIYATILYAPITQVTVAFVAVYCMFDSWAKSKRAKR